MCFNKCICIVDVIASRGERLELLVDKTEDLSNSVCVTDSFLCRLHIERMSASFNPLSSDRQHLSYDVCRDVRGDYQNCSVLYCVLKLCTVISTLS